MIIVNKVISKYPLHQKGHWGGHLQNKNLKKLDALTDPKVLSQLMFALHGEIGTKAAARAPNPLQLFRNTETQKSFNYLKNLSKHG